MYTDIDVTQNVSDAPAFGRLSQLVESRSIYTPVEIFACHRCSDSESIDIGRFSLAHRYFADVRVSSFFIINRSTSIINKNSELVQRVCTTPQVRQGVLAGRREAGLRSFLTVEKDRCFSVHQGMSSTLLLRDAVSGSLTLLTIQLAYKLRVALSKECRSCNDQQPNQQAPCDRLPSQPVTLSCRHKRLKCAATYCMLPFSLISLFCLLPFSALSLSSPFPSHQEAHTDRRIQISILTTDVCLDR